VVHTHVLAGVSRTWTCQQTGDIAHQRRAGGTRAGKSSSESGQPEPQSREPRSIAVYAIDAGVPAADPQPVHSLLRSQGLTCCMSSTPRSMVQPVALHGNVSKQTPPHSACILSNVVSREYSCTITAVAKQLAQCLAAACAQLKNEGGAERPSSMANGRLGAAATLFPPASLTPTLLAYSDTSSMAATWVGKPS